MIYPKRCPSDDKPWTLRGALWGHTMKWFVVGAPVVLLVGPFLALHWLLNH